MRILSTTYRLIASRFFLPILALIATALPSASQPGNNPRRALTAPMTDVTVQNLAAINSGGDEAAPTISATEGVLYFTSSREGKLAVYVSRRTGEKEWTAPERFLDLPGKESISGITISADGRRALMTGCNRQDGIFSTCDIYSGEIVDGRLTNITSLGRNVNSEWWDAQPSISPDGSFMLFASDRKGGKGGFDLYMSNWNGSAWTQPVNVGFNTSGDELSPFVSHDNRTVYFAADDLDGGQGGFDIYMVEKTGDNAWSRPVNLGEKVNSRSNELFFSLPPSEDAIYFASDRKGGAGGMDIYRVSPNPVKPVAKMITLKGRVLDAETGLPVEGPEIQLSLGTTGESLTNASSGAEFSTTIGVGKLVKIMASAEGYVANSVEVQAPNDNEPPTFSRDIKLAPAHARIEGTVTNVMTQKPLNAVVILEEMDANGKVKSTFRATTNASGAFSFNANPGVSYRIGTTVSDYDPITNSFTVPASREAMVRVEKHLRLQPAEIDAVLVHFDFNKSDLKKPELPKFDRFIQQVKENPYVKIEVNGHTDDVGSDEYNEKLSARRALAVEDYLLSRGVPRDQLAIVKGFGKSLPLAAGESEEARAKNRRVEVRIVGKGN